MASPWSGSRWLILLALFLGLIVPLQYSSWYAFTLQVESAERSFALETEQSADVLAMGMSKPVWNLIPNLGKPLLESVATRDFVQSVRVSSLDDVEFLSYGDVEQPSSILIRRDILHGSEKIGEILLAIDSSHFQSQIDEQWRQIVAVLIAQVLLSILVIYSLFHMSVHLERERARGRANAELIANEKRLRDIASNIPGMVFKISQDEAGNNDFLYISSFVREFLGLEPEDIIADWNVWRKVIHPEDYQAYVASSDAARQSGERWQHRYRMFTSSGDIRWLHTSSLPTKLEDGSIEWNGVLLDVTELHETEDELRKARDSLEQQVMERTQELTNEISERKLVEQQTLEAKLSAEQASKAKSEFLSSMSHELRTPLNAILGFGQLLESDPKQPLTQSQSKAVTHIINGGNHLLELINQLLSLSQIESGEIQVDMESIDFPNLLQDCLPSIGVIAQARSIAVLNRVDMTKPCYVWADRLRLKQVLLNLLSNAVKYNRDGGTIVISAEQGADQRLYLRVSDTGTGISQQHREVIFEPFKRVGRLNTGIAGTGVGLAIARQLVELMEGSIELEMSGEEGSTFCVALPVPTS